MLNSDTWKEQLASMTPAQKEFLAQNRGHLCPASPLNDGDWLVLDRYGPPPQLPMAKFVDHYGPYILTRGGKLQGVNWHYFHEHLMNVRH